MKAPLVFFLGAVPCPIEPPSADPGFVARGFAELALDGQLVLEDAALAFAERAQQFNAFFVGFSVLRDDAVRQKTVEDGVFLLGIKQVVSKVQRFVMGSAAQISLRLDAGGFFRRDFFFHDVVSDQCHFARAEQVLFHEKADVFARGRIADGVCHKRREMGFSDEACPQEPVGFVEPTGGNQPADFRHCGHRDSPSKGMERIGRPAEQKARAATGNPGSPAGVRRFGTMESLVPSDEPGDALSNANPLFLGGF